MEYWIVVLINILIGLLISMYNVLIAVPVVLLGLTFGLVLIILKKLWRS